MNETDHNLVEIDPEKLGGNSGFPPKIRKSLFLIALAEYALGQSVVTFCVDNEEPASFSER